jgi:hypothetical protein
MVFAYIRAFQLLTDEILSSALVFFFMTDCKVCTRLQYVSVKMGTFVKPMDNVNSPTFLLHLFEGFAMRSDNKVYGFVLAKIRINNK